MTASKIAKMFVLSLLALSFISCLPSNNRQAKGQRISLTTEFNTLKAQVDSKPEITSEWSDAELDEHERLINKMNSILDILVEQKETGTIDINSVSSTRIELKFKSDKIRKARAEKKYLKIEKINEIEKLSVYSEDHKKIMKDLSDRSLVLTLAYVSFSSNGVMINSDFEELISLKKEYKVQYDYVIDYNNAVSKIEGNDKPIEQGIEPHLAKLEADIFYLSALEVSQSELRDVNFSVKDIASEEFQLIISKKLVSTNKIYLLPDVNSINEEMSLAELYQYRVKLSHSIILYNIYERELDARLSKNLIIKVDAIKLIESIIDDSLILTNMLAQVEEKILELINKPYDKLNL